MQCPTCNLTFAHAKAQDEHFVHCPNPLFVKYPNGTFQVLKAQKGQLKCHCSHTKCPRLFKNYKALLSHIEHASLPWVGPTQVCIESYLESFNMLKTI